MIGQPRSSTREPRTVVHVVQHELCGSQAFRIARKLESIPLRRGDTLVLDLDSVGSLDATGMAVLVRVRGQARRVGVDLRLKNPNPEIRSLLTRTGAHHVLRWEPSPRFRARRRSRLAVPAMAGGTHG
jgi:anti-anti-sigma factor